MQDLTLPSRCDDWVVSEVIEHSAAVTMKFASFAAGATDAPRSERRSIDPQDPVAIVHDARLAARAAWPVVDRSRHCELPFGTFAADMAAGINLFDVLAHTWDVTDALGLELCCDDDLWGAGFDAVRGVIGADRDTAHYGAPLDIDADAPIGLRFLAYLGRA